MQHALQALLALWTLSFFACVTVEETGRHRLAPFPESYMDQLGVASYKEIKQKVPISQNGALTAEIDQIGRRVAQATGKTYQWEFTLFETKDVNAWCLPGGKVGVYTGIIPVAKTNAGLAAVLGHEIGHAIARHQGERMSEELLVKGTLMGVDELLANHKYRQLAMSALGLGAQFGVILPFSRTQELEADQLGLTYMAKAGYDPREAVTLWQRMAKLGKEPPAILSDHPTSAAREEALRKQLPKAMDLWEKSQKVTTIEL